MKDQYYVTYLDPYTTTWDALSLIFNGCIFQLFIFKNRYYTEINS